MRKGLDAVTLHMWFPETNGRIYSKFSIFDIILIVSSSGYQIGHDKVYIKVDPLFDRLTRVRSVRRYAISEHMQFVIYGR